MNELLLPIGVRALPGVDKPRPDLGYNFSTGQSTGQFTGSVSGAAASSQELSSYPIAGYDHALLVGTKEYAISPPSMFSVGTGDFTLEWVSYGLTGNGSSWIWRWLGSVALYIQYASSTWGGRLALRNNKEGGYNAIDQLASAHRNSWHHFVYQRRNGLLQVWVDGVEQGLSYVSTLDFQKGGRPYTANITAVTSAYINSTQFPTNMLMAEFAFYKTAIYTEDFTPTYPLVTQ